MTDSLLAPFVQSVAPLQVTSPSYDPPCSPRRYTCNTSDCGVDEVSRPLASRRIDETGGVLKHGHNRRPPGIEPLAPPTAPATAERTIQASLSGCHCAVAAQNKVWKKLRAKLGFGGRCSVGGSHRPSRAADITHSRLDPAQGLALGH
jgi:hypothetical protein